MQAIRKTSPVAPRPREASEFRGAKTQSPEQSASATSGTYFRAVRTTRAEAEPLAPGTSAIAGAKVEGLRFELEVGVWRGDSDRIARCVIDDAECTVEAGNDDG